MAETKKAGVSFALPDPQTPRPEPKKVTKKYEVLRDKIVETLDSGGPQRVLLAGEAGIGKTWIARKVEERVMKSGWCYQTIWLHLNKKYKVNKAHDKDTFFEDEWTLYENIASQLCLYSDFEETEVGDRDEEEEEEKKVKDVLKDMKAEIKKYLKEKKELFEKKLTPKLAAENPEADKTTSTSTGKKLDKREVDKTAKTPAVKKGDKPENKNQPAEGKEKPAEADKKSGEGKEKPAEADVKSAEGKEKPAEADENPAEEKENKDASDKPSPYLLLILDDEGMTKEHEVMAHLGLDDFLKDLTPRKILITRRESNEKATKSGGEIKEGNESPSKDKEGDEHSEGGTESGGEINEVSHPTAKAEDTKQGGKTVPSTIDELWKVSDSYWKIELPTTDVSEDLLEPFSDQEPVCLFQSLISDLPAYFLESFKGSDGIMISHLAKKSKTLPAGIVVLAKSIECTIRNSTDELSRGKTKELIKEKILMVLSAERDESTIQESGSEGSLKLHGENPILVLAYELLKISPLHYAILDCFWHSLDFFEHCGSVYYRDLITQWILEGYFDPVRSVESAYNDGHLILMELIDRGLLKIQENNVVVPEMAMKNVIDPRRRGHLGRSKLGFSRVYAGEKRKGIGKINQIDDMIKTVQAKKGVKISTLLVSGDRLRRETSVKYFKKLDDLEVLGLFEPAVEPFVPDIFRIKNPPGQNHIEKLRVLVIRDCDLLHNIEELKALRGLQALEISGASSLKNISDEFFTAMPDLESLHLSGLRIKSSPSSISLLKKLHCLIIKDCPLLEDLPDIQELLELEVVDVSGARGLQTCFDNTPGKNKNKSKNKNFYHLTYLQLLDFSESQIERLPIFQDAAKPEKLHRLTRLLLRNCSKLRRLPSLKPLSGLQILDLSGTTSLVEMLEVCFEDKKELRTLNLTGTNLNELATTIEELSDLKELLLKDCTNLEEIPNIQKLTNLEVIDVSGCTKLHKIEGSFRDMSYLREVNLRDTKVETPELPDVSKIHGPKCFIGADGKSFKGEEWSQIKKDIESAKTEGASSSGAVVETREISEEEPEEVKILPDEPCAGDCTQTGDISKERLLQVPIDRDIYTKILLSFVSPIPRGVMEINETNDPSEEALSNAEFVSFVDVSSTRLSSIFKKINSVTGCWIRLSSDIKDLFFEVDVARLGSLETLSITNIPGLDSISRGGRYKNLKNLIIDDCPSIVMLFPDASQLPSSLEILHIKKCEKLEKVFKEGEVSTLITLWLVELPVLSFIGAKLPNLETLVKKDCPKLRADKEELKIMDFVAVDSSDAQPEAVDHSDAAPPQPQA